ncbi:MAG: BrnA antitoxin family protein [Chloroflexi bacterium]|nr:BrnA antitoxin family protein [Chloroflexota bacterium]MYI03879.1 BrnA antitoxin family protein [Chloroflexota bacterium]
MTKGLDDLPTRVQQELLALDELADEDIDLSDIPEITDWSGAERGKFYRPVKQQITLRIDADVIAWFKAQAPQGRGYQTNINQALRDHVQRTARSTR